MIRTFTIIIIILSSFVNKAFSKGIIIADDNKQQQLFETADSSEICHFANQLSTLYADVILHLGRSYPFASGNIYSSYKSRENLYFFCKTLKDLKLNIYLWFFDSYGSRNFNTLFNDHNHIINENINALDSMNIPFDGIAIDMEWINKGSRESNNNRYIQILRDLRNKLPNKKIYCFASLLERPKSNSERGYDTDKILQYADNIIAMLYLDNAEFFITTPTNKPKMDVERVDKLRKYFKQQGWLVAVSLQPGILFYNDKASTYQLMPPVLEGKDAFLTHARIKNLTKDELASVYEYKIKKNKTLHNADNGQPIKLHKRTHIFYFELNEKKVSLSNDYIWEYFSMKAAL